MAFVVTRHCRDRYRERIGPKSLSDAEVNRRVRRACDDGRRATKREAREINAELAARTGGPPARHAGQKSRRASLLMHEGICFVVGRGQGTGGEHVVITCWRWPCVEAEAA